jgi:hypothetical protein
MNSWCRWRCMLRPMTVPSSTLRAANSVVVPSAQRRVVAHVVASCDLAEPPRARRCALCHLSVILAQGHGEAGAARLDRSAQLLGIIGLRIAKERFFSFPPPLPAQCCVQASKETPGNKLAATLGEGASEPRLMPEFNKSQKARDVRLQAVQFGLDYKVAKSYRAARTADEQRIATFALAGKKQSAWFFSNQSGHGRCRVEQPSITRLLQGEELHLRNGLQTRIINEPNMCRVLCYPAKPPDRLRVPFQMKRVFSQLFAPDDEASG